MYMLLPQTILASITKCEHGVTMPLGDLPGMPLNRGGAEECFAECEGDPNCMLFTFHKANCSYAGETCKHEAGCCWLKRAEVGGVAPDVNNCTCSGFVRVPKTSFKPARRAPKRAKNVLYILVDDLRPELQAYGQNSWTHHSPHIKALSESGTVFDNAHCQISVCSPSRLSFLTGRRPDNAGMYNFINHFRQADCGLVRAGVSLTGRTFKTTIIGGCGWGGMTPCGGSGQCCTLCSEIPKCKAWTYVREGSRCELKIAEGKAKKDLGAISGSRGTFETHAKWTTIPQHFRNNGYLALSAGKIFHSEEGGSGNMNADLNGPGMPPNADPPSWSDGLSMKKVNAVANMFPCKMGPDTNCPVDADIHGMVRSPLTTPQLCDRIIADDAVVKLRLAARNLRETGQPFFMAAGFRKPHLDFRFPRPFLNVLPDESVTDIAKHPTLHPCVPSIAHFDAPPQRDPYKPPNNETAKQWRLFYRAAVAWVDSQIGRVLTELKALDLDEDTMIVLHSDHGFSLGEHGEWQKFSNFEHGTRVPLIMRVPWIRASTKGVRTKVLAELIDIFPTMADALDLPLDSTEELDGTSLLAVLKRPKSASIAAATKSYALSQYPRCPKDSENPMEHFKVNDCNMIDRSQIDFVGYSIRTAKWRYTEWVRWNGSTLRPIWSEQVGTELYSHEGDDGFDFDAFENSCDNDQHPDVVEELSEKLHNIVDNQRMLWRSGARRHSFVLAREDAGDMNPSEDEW
eukprot:TRINITY_DN6587_c0_g1_i1.p1 TRINITY_DN6587_c0_g1~~TRINITY_DN6587_c0_g1_i1.p1  ORF type:complete len:740 (-),score=57.78 TRINITY_DN6587_c0_g1_i1:99-2318(-)